MSLLRTYLMLLVLLCHQATMFEPSRASPDERERAARAGKTSPSLFERTLRPVVAGFRLFVGVVLSLETAADYAAATPSGALSKHIFALLPMSIPEPSTPPLFLIAVLAIALGCILRVLSFHTMKALFTYEVSLSARHKLVTSGPYAVVRHPGYTALLLVQVSLPLLCLAPGSGSWWWGAGVAHSRLGHAVVGTWAALLGHVALIVRRASAEDALLHGVFGREWEAYARSVRCRFIPGVL
ncbi:hypothetical protein FA95DRAFT_1596409 [Auriscalpium vulgare]|uniref:Uncharacterized protein n=1 Tax=Auriscalpium vulgare TaxID=40419 RepID=A0ACB8RQJ4_9AGAM|nr:hypothetical protein FA95DRAFT_1596409 [Auriscalpium vulgare]